MSRLHRMRARAALAAAIALAVHLTACAMGPKPRFPRVLQKDREFLSDPVMQPAQDELESLLESHIRPLREGSPGGDASAGGGCGC